MNILLSGAIANNNSIYRLNRPFLQFQGGDFSEKKIANSMEIFKVESFILCFA